MFLKRIFGALEPTYLIRAYVISAVFMAMIAWFVIYMAKGEPLTFDRIATLMVFGIGALLFPFSKLVWDEIKRVMMGSNIFILPVIILMPLKLLVNYALWCFSIFIAPLGIAYLWLRSRQSARPERLEP